MASQCYMAGRIEEAVRYSDAGQMVIGSGRDEVPFGLEGLLGAAYMVIGQPERTVEWCRAQLARGRDTHTLTRTTLVIALTMAGRGDEAMAAANGLIEAAEATRNPLCSRSRFSPMGSPSATLIPTAHWTPCAGAW